MNSINVSGSNNQINAVSGSNNVQKNTMNVTPYDFDSLCRYLQHKGLNTNEINELKGILTTDKPDIENRALGAQAKDWIQRILASSLAFGINISGEAAGAILTSVISRYYNM